MCYNINRKGKPYRRLVLSLVKEITALLDWGGYFFFVMLITSATIETIRFININKSLYVTISHHPPLKIRREKKTLLLED